MMEEDALDRSRQEYLRVTERLRDAFLAGRSSGVEIIRDRSAAAEALVQSFWPASTFGDGGPGSGIALIATGGYGRSELFPASDLDLLFLIEDAGKEKAAKEPIRRICQQLWDSGIRVAASTRQIAECERFDPANAEFTLSLLDARRVAGDAVLADRFVNKCLPELLHRERKAISARLLELTDERHARYGDTLFHLEPNVKECPGGLRDANVCGWLAQLHADAQRPGTEFNEAFGFLAAVRCFLHLRTGRDVNALDWRTQDDAAAAGIGVPGGGPRDAAHWMQLYFRHARVIARGLAQQVESLPKARPLLQLPQAVRRRLTADIPGMRVERGRGDPEWTHTGVRSGRGRRCGIACLSDCG